MQEGRFKGLGPGKCRGQSGSAQLRRLKEVKEITVAIRIRLLFWKGGRTAHEVQNSKAGGIYVRYISEDALT
jgi:hypothetical protein